MNSGQPDLDAYPILRIDQLSLIDIGTLKSSIDDVRDLLKSLQREEQEKGKSQESMIKYVRKQLVETDREIASREAEDRVNALLHSTTNLLVQTFPRFDEDHKNDVCEEKGKLSPKLLSSESLNNKRPVNHSNDPPPVAFYKPIPLPSQIESSSKALSRSRTLSHDNPGVLYNTSSEASENARKNTHSADTAQRPSVKRNISSSETEMLTSRSSNAVHSPAKSVDKDSSSHQDNACSDRSIPRRPRSGSLKSRRPKSIYSQENLMGPGERQRRMDLQQNFGNAFVVGATEKKKRFAPKKVVEETENEKREKMREKSRQQAMMRLLERKNKQIERNEEMKRRRMEEKAANRKKQLEHERLKRAEESKKTLTDPPPKISASKNNVQVGAQNSRANDLDSPCSSGCNDGFDMNPSSDDESLSGDDNAAKSIIISQNEVDNVAMESVQAFDSNILKQESLLNNAETDHHPSLVQQSTFEDELTGTTEYDKAFSEAVKNVTKSVGEKNKAALNTLRKLKSKQKVTPRVEEEDESPENEGSSKVDVVHQTMKSKNLDDLAVEKAPVDAMYEDCTDVMFGGMGGNEEDNEDEAEEGGGLELKRRVGMNDEETEEVGEVDKTTNDSNSSLLANASNNMFDANIVNSDEDEENAKKTKKKKKTKRKTKRVKYVLVNEEGEEIEVVQDVERKKRKKKRRKDRETVSESRGEGEREGDRAGDEDEGGAVGSVGLLPSNNPTILAEHEENKEAKAGSIAGGVAAGKEGDKQPSSSSSSSGSQSDLDRLFCSYFVGDSIFSTSSRFSETGEEMTVHVCRRGPDDLAGLRAWVLSSLSETGKPKWEVDMSQLNRCVNDSLHSSLQKQRSLMKKSTSYGIILLARVCESLMLGQDYPYSQSEDTLFRQNWQNRISQFDSIAADLSPSMQSALFAPVWVCGNAAAVASKLENLVATAFRQAVGKFTEVGKLKGAEEVEEEMNQAESKICDSESSVSSKSSSFSESDYSDSDDEYVDHFRGAIDMLSDDVEVPKDEFSADTKEIEQRMAFFLQEDSGNSGRVNEATHDDEDVEDDDKQMNETSQQSSATTSETKMGANHIHDHSSKETAQARVESLEEPSAIIKTGRRGSKKVKGIRDRSTVSAASSKKSLSISGAIGDSRKLSEIYKSIAEIFPAVRSKMDSMKKGCHPGDHASLAKTLLECMHVQLKVYEDWLEVMDDYATVFCSDTERGVEVSVNRNDPNAAVYSGGSAALHYRVKSSRLEVNNIIKDVFSSKKDWEELPTGLGLGVSWNLLWSWAKPKIKMTEMLIWQRVNHFQSSKELTRKDNLKKNLSKFTHSVGNKAASHFEIMPQTFILPAEYTSFVKAFSDLEQVKEMEQKNSNGAETSFRNLWIVKPVGLSRGRGISMLSDLSSLSYSQSTILQRYIDKPLCLDGYKFDLRIYVVVTSFQPLEAFIYRDGFARVSTVKYTSDQKSLSNLYIHLTNSSIQKKSESGPTKDNPLHISQGNNEESNGSKIGILGKTGLWKRLESCGIDTKSLWDSMCFLITKSLVAVEDKIPNQPCSFELFGYDVLFDDELRPWLIEVNSGPSLARETQLDMRVKNELISDIIKLVDPAPFDRAALTKVLRDRIQSLKKKKCSMTTADADLEADLRAILGDHVPRCYGEEPRDCGNFERLCPGTKHFSSAMKLKSMLVKAPVKKA